MFGSYFHTEYLNDTDPDVYLRKQLIVLAKKDKKPMWDCIFIIGAMY